MSIAVGYRSPWWLALVFICALIIQAFFAYTSVIDVWEARFWNMPWTDAVPAGKGLVSAPYIGQPCPFTGLSPCNDSIYVCR